jgi:hypothetical protein
MSKRPTPVHVPAPKVTKMVRVTRSDPNPQQARAAHARAASSAAGGHDSRNHKERTRRDVIKARIGEYA